MRSKRGVARLAVLSARLLRAAGACGPATDSVRGRVHMRCVHCREAGAWGSAGLHGNGGLGPVCAVALRCELDRIVAIVDDFGQAEVSNFDLKVCLLYGMLGTLWYAGYSMVCWVLYGMLGTQGNDAKRQ